MFPESRGHLDEAVDLAERVIQFGVIVAICECLRCAGRLGETFGRRVGCGRPKPAKGECFVTPFGVDVGHF